jgi:hypothetical protein
MTTSRCSVPLSEIDEVRVPVEGQVEEHDATPPVPDLEHEGDRDRETVMRTGAGG